MYKKIKKNLCLITVITFLVQQALIPMVYGEEGDLEEQTPAITETTPTPEATITITPTPEPTIIPTITPIIETTITPAATPTATPTPTENLTEVENENTSSADTGNNQSNSPDSEVTIETGLAIAYVNLINLLNTTLTGSSFHVYFINRFEGTTENLDLNEMWKNAALINSEGIQVQKDKNNKENENNLVLISLKNDVILNNSVDVTANSGNNSATTNSGALIVSGDATALANIVNLVNSKILDSTFTITFINIDGKLLGDLILPSPENFQNNQPDNTDNNSDNQINLTNSTITNASSGNNEINNSNNALTNTGNANAIANLTSLLNINANSDSRVWITVNNTGDWSGKVYNWSNPGAIEDASNVTSFVLGGLLLNGRLTSTSYLLNLDNNEITVNNNVDVNASTGNNKINDSSQGEIKTGNASAIANLTNLINLNLSKSNWFFGTVNIIGGWKGNIIFAYPDLAVAINSIKSTVKKGEQIEYSVQFANNGYEDAENIKLELELDQGTEYANDNSGLEKEINGNKITWKLGKMQKGENRLFNLSTTTDKKQTANRIKFYLIKPAFAEETTKQYVAKIVITNSKIESNNDNNSSVAITNQETIISSENTQDERSQSGLGLGSEPEQQLNLKIDAKNNVNDFVYPKDIVTFETKVNNDSEIPSYDTYLVHIIYDKNGTIVSENELALGDVGPHKNGTVYFGIEIPYDTISPELFSETYLVGYDKFGKEHQSNTAKTKFAINIIKNGVVKGVKATDNNTTAERLGICKPTENLLPYILAFSVSALWLIDKTGKGVKRFKKIKNEKI